METRKLQKIGGSTYSVSLPKEWATEHHLEAGMPIHLYPHTDGSLVVRSAAQDGGPLSAVTVDLPTADTNAVERALRAAYAVGYDTITLLAPETTEFTADERRAVRRLVQTMVGLSVTEETTDRLVVENLLDASEVSIRQSVIQLQFTACSMHRTAIERVANRATERESDRLAGRDDEVDRLFEMITRHFNRSLADFAEIDDLDVRRSELFDYYLVARQLERIADHAVRIGALASRIDPTVDDDVFAEVGALAGATCEVAETATTAVLETSAERAHEALDRRDAVGDDLRALDRALFERSPPGAYALSRVLASLTRTADCGANVARVALRASVRPDE
ncbi:phosphate uptake regulator PhoU [Haloplanus aerogenes]|uniref:Phosphate uptake regulator n=1 Tax=Haloplanus aerogenes TaxID=660522 RepID=A0A3M0DQC4_9EURY|nr:phosphate uptake regulator PhoU [Haloplanus aerogenes]AZH24597.1 phosphate uptake regulator PhoU [Haloplanus aerogenes]RMB23745.1 phosphate uptake regulator [Haloplanus aerogenes]